MLTFGTSVAVNNLLALKSFSTFLFNYQLHEKPSWLEKKLIPHLKRWVEKRAESTMADLLTDEEAKSASVALNDAPGDFFAVLYLVHNPHLLAEVRTGVDLFLLLAQMALEFEKVKKPKQDTGYKQNA